MPTYLRPELADANPSEVADYLLGLGITSAVTALADGMYIETDVDATAALSAFTPTVSADAEYIAKVPTTSAVAQHLQHIKDFRTAIRSGGTAPSLAQTQHVLADVIDALRLLDARLNRDV